MTRWLLLLGVLVALSGAAEAAPLPPWRVRAVVDALAADRRHALSELVAACRRAYAPAVVTSGFYDARGVSIYRRVPGLHLGYDIAMPAGAAAPCAWPGRVIAVTPWTDTEWGVTVLHDDGSTATYGHIHPRVAVGDAVMPGHTLGTIAVDHLDVKMRDRHGRPLDFGESAVAVVAEPWREWLRARFAAAEAAARVASLQREAAHVRTALGRPVPAAEADRRRLEAGLITPREAARRDDERARARQARERLGGRQRALAAELRSAEAQHAAAARELRSAEARARAAGVTWADVERRIAERLAADARLRRLAATAPSPRGANPRTAADHGLDRHEALLRAGLITARAYERATGRPAPVEPAIEAVGE